MTCSRRHSWLKPRERDSFLVCERCGSTLPLNLAAHYYEQIMKSRSADFCKALRAAVRWNRLSNVERARLAAGKSLVPNKGGRPRGSPKPLRIRKLY